MKLVATQHLSVISAMFTQEELQKDTYSFNGVEVLFVTTWPMYAQMQTVTSSEWQIISKGHTQCIGTWHKCRTCERPLLTSK
jgi:hypothetical protein